MAATTKTSKTKEISLINSSSKILVDKSAFFELDKYRWFIDPEGYARATIKGKRVRLHRLLMNFPVDKSIDHINRNKLDNRRSNLRVCDPRFNNANTPPHLRNKSGFKGVSWAVKNKKWVVQICVRGKRMHVGLFKEKDVAARAYNEVAKAYYGEFAYLNKV